MGLESKMEKKKSFREEVSEKVHGKKKYRIRKQLEQDGDKEIEQFISSPSCLDSAYERLAIDQGMNNSPVFPENKEYIKRKYAN